MVTSNCARTSGRFHFLSIDDESSSAAFPLHRSRRLLTIRASDLAGILPPCVRSFHRGARSRDEETSGTDSTKSSTEPSAPYVVRADAHVPRCAFRFVASKSGIPHAQTAADRTQV